MAVILGAVEPGAIPLIGDCIEQHTQFILVGLQLRHGQGAETALNNAHEPCGEVGRNRSTLLIIHLDLLGFHGQISGFHNRLRQFGVLVCIGNIPNRVGCFQLLGHIVHPELVEVDLGKFQILGSVIPLERLAASAAGLEFLQGNPMLLLELGIQLICIGIVQVNQGSFGRSLLYLAQAAAGGLQNHVLGAVAFLRKDDASQTATVPAFLANLNQQNDADSGNRVIQSVELHLTVGGLRILLVALVEFQNHISGQAVVGDNSGNKGIHHFFQLFDGTAVDAQFGGQAAFI